MPEKELPLL